jgi:hypothetical protein
MARMPNESTAAREHAILAEVTDPTAQSRREAEDRLETARLEASQITAEARP